MSQYIVTHDPAAVTAVQHAAAALAREGIAVTTCPNCGVPLIGDYCAVCGQEKDIHRRSVRGILHDFFEDMLNFDSRIVRTIVALLVEPGEIAIAFREGRTRRYVPALRLYFFVTLIFFLLLSLTNLAIIQLELSVTPAKAVQLANGQVRYLNPAYDAGDAALRGVPKYLPERKGKDGKPEKHYMFDSHVFFFAPIGKYHTQLTNEERAGLDNMNVEVDAALGQAKPATPAQKKKAEAEKKKVAGWVERNIFGGIKRLANDPTALNGPMTVWIPRALFLLMPLYALLLAAFYWRQRKDYYFVDHLIFSLTVHTFTFVALIGAAALAQVLSGGIVAWLLFFAIGLYVVIGMKRFYHQGWGVTVLKFGTVSFLYTCFFLLPALGGIMLLGFFGDPFG
ncbi:MAG: DUF3667 domain-containing protein [Proteobacteria bacterium]|nr:DUF3667 domain-containing protein [Pseudomonadota bacterium]